MYKKRKCLRKMNWLPQTTLCSLFGISQKTMLSPNHLALGIWGGNVSAVQGLDLFPMEYLENKVMTKTAHKGKEIFRLTTLE